MKLPYSAREIADVIGTEKALFLISQLPRCVTIDRRYPTAKAEQVILYVPTLARLKPNHNLVRILGLEHAEALCRAFGGGILKPANCAGIYREFRDKNIRRLLAEGAPIQMLAEWFGVCERHVKNLARENPREEPRAANDNNSGHRNRPGTKLNELARVGQPSA